MTAPRTFVPVSFGPVLRGVIDAANPVSDLKGSVHYARNAILEGGFKLRARAGTQLALTLKDDQGSPADVTSVVAIVPFGDGALAVAHSTVTQKFYLYWLKDDLTDWYNSSKALGGTTTPAPVAVVWTAAASPAQVIIAEGLGIAYIAHRQAGSTFKTQKFDTTVTPAVLSAFQADLRGSGLEDTYFRGLVSFQQHLWGWGYGSQAASNNDRPELARFSTPFFGPMAQADSFAVGHRVRSAREQIVLGIVAGQTLYLGTNFSVWPVTGFGRNSWDKSRPIDDAYGFAGVRAAAAGPNGYLYYWSHRGPMRVLGYGPPEPLWPRLATTIASVVNEQNVVCGYDLNVDQIVWLYQDQASGRVSRLCAYDVLREAILGPDGDVGLGVNVLAFVTPIFTTVGPGPAAPPNTPSTTAIGTTIATANWVNGDTSPDTVTQLEYRTPQGSGAWTVAKSDIAAGVTTYQLTGLLGLTAYEWRAKHVRNGVSSTYLGPVAGSQFTTIGQLQPPSNCGISAQLLAPNLWKFTITWTNSAESGVSTEVWYALPGQAFSLNTTRPPGEASTVVVNGVAGNHQAKVRHVRSGSTTSNYSNTASVVVP